MSCHVFRRIRSIPRSQAAKLVVIGGVCDLQLLRFVGDSVCCSPGSFLSECESPPSDVVVVKRANDAEELYRTLQALTQQ